MGSVDRVRRLNIPQFTARGTFVNLNEYGKIDYKGHLSEPQGISRLFDRREL
jgi:hypothetical protein